MDKEISKAVIKRLPRYYRYLGQLQEEGVEHISSAELSRKMKVTASQIRQDLNHFGGFGQQGYGYQVKYLYNEIGKILGLEEDHKLIIIGAGNLGQAIANYSKFERFGFHFDAMFDSNPALAGKEIRGIPIYPADKLEEYLSEHHVDAAALTVPSSAAGKLADLLVSCGVRAIWNFAHVDLELPENIVVENVHLSDSLMQLGYNISHMDQ